MLCPAADILFDIEDSRSTVYLEVPENVTITSPGEKIANPINEETINLVIEDYEGKMEFLPENIAEIFPNLRNFWIIDCFMEKVTKANFQSLKVLQLLSILRNENFTTIEENSFEDLMELRDLYLQSNSIAKLEPKTFSKLEKLEVLDLSENKLTTLNEALFKNNIKLEYLNINDNKLLRIVPEAFRNLKSLQKIWLSNNEITHLPNNTFLHNENLTELHLDGNELSSIDINLLSQLTKLRKVSFAGNLLIAFDFEIIWPNENLFEISLSDNNIVSIANVHLIQNMTGLHEVNLVNNSCVNQVFFGISGDIVHKKMYYYQLEEKCSRNSYETVTSSTVT